MLGLAEVAGIGVRELGSIERGEGNPSLDSLRGKREHLSTISGYGALMVRLPENK